MDEPSFWRKVGIYFGVADHPAGDPAADEPAITVRRAVWIVICVATVFLLVDLVR